MTSLLNQPKCNTHDGFYFQIVFLLCVHKIYILNEFDLINRNLILKMYDEPTSLKIVLIIKCISVYI